MNKNSRKRKVYTKENRVARRTGTNEVISVNTRRNMKMTVVKGYDENKVNFSRTVHCKNNPNKPAFPKVRRDSGTHLEGPPMPSAPVPGTAVEQQPEVAVA